MLVGQADFPVGDVIDEERTQVGPPHGIDRAVPRFPERPRPQPSAMNPFSDQPDIDAHPSRDLAWRIFVAILQEFFKPGYVAAQPHDVQMPDHGFPVSFEARFSQCVDDGLYAEMHVFGDDLVFLPRPPIFSISGRPLGNGRADSDAPQPDGIRRDAKLFRQPTDGAFFAGCVGSTNSLVVKAGPGVGSHSDFFPHAITARPAPIRASVPGSGIGVGSPQSFALPMQRNSHCLGSWP